MMRQQGKVKGCVFTPAALGGFDRAGRIMSIGYVDGNQGRDLTWGRRFLSSINKTIISRAGNSPCGMRRERFSLSKTRSGRQGFPRSRSC